MPTECCRHIRTTGRRCNSPAMRDKAFCFYHDRSRTRHRSPAQKPAGTGLILHPMRPHFTERDSFGQQDPMEIAPQPQPLTLEFPLLEDRESIQVAASMIVSALGRNQLDSKRAATMLYGLQVASAVTHFDIHPADTCMMQIESFNTPEGEDLSADDDPQIHEDPQAPQDPDDAQGPDDPQAPETAENPASSA